MSKQKSISDIVSDLQTENEHLKGLEKLFDRAVREEFGYTIKQLHELVRKQEYYEQKKAERQGQHSQI